MRKRSAFLVSLPRITYVMKNNIKLVIYFLLCLVVVIFVPVDSGKYDVIIIPVQNKQDHPTQLLKLALGKNSQRTKKQKKLRRSNSNVKLEIESYDDSTDIPDIDNFNPLDRGGDSRSEERYEVYGNDKIVGGVEVDINLYPYHVGYGSICGGAIIDKKWVITVGHCGKLSYIKTGSKYFNQGKKINVTSNHLHPFWSASNKKHEFDYDFQVLKLAENLKFDENTQPLKVAHTEDMVIGKVVTVTGWGHTVENGPNSKVLRAVRVPIIGKKICQNVPFPYFQGSLTNRMFCAGFIEGKKDACQGDSGSPAVADNRLLGLVSFGYGCAIPGSYGVYSKVSKVRAWLEAVTGLKFD